MAMIRKMVGVVKFFILKLKPQRGYILKGVCCMSKHVRSVCGVAAALIFSSLFVVGCGSPGPSAVAERFFTALANGDMETVGKYATPKTITTVTTFGDKLQKAAQMAGKVTRSTETIDGDAATVTLYFENSDPDEFKLVKIDGKWKVDIDINSGGK
jgi:hypothetical protein